jgi:hypothetical protein
MLWSFAETQDESVNDLMFDDPAAALVSEIESPQRQPVETPRVSVSRRLALMFSREFRLPVSNPIQRSTSAPSSPQQQHNQKHGIKRQQSSEASSSGNQTFGWSRKSTESNHVLTASPSNRRAAFVSPTSSLQTLDEDEGADLFPFDELNANPFQAKDELFRDVATQAALVARTMQSQRIDSQDSKTSAASSDQLRFDSLSRFSSRLSQMLSPKN